VNLGTARIVVIVGLVVAGAVVLANGFPDDQGAAATPTGSPPTASPTTSPGATTSPTQAPTQTPSPQPPKDVTFMALNGTEVTGAGADAQTLLEKDGYVAAAAAADAPSKGVQTTTIYYRGGANADQNKSDATSIADQHFQGAEIKKLDTSLQNIVPPEANVVVVVGQDYAQSLVQ
jgi:hypothetical protein